MGHTAGDEARTLCYVPLLGFFSKQSFGEFVQAGRLGYTLRNVEPGSQLQGVFPESSYTARPALRIHMCVLVYSNIKAFSPQ